jgi:hypothetical protein
MSGVGETGMFTGDTRGVAPVIGFLLVFAILIVSFAGYQAVVVPDHNAEVEFDHSLRVQSDVQDLRAAIVGAPSYANESRSVSIELGLSYPGRALAVNAGPPSGNLRTADEVTPGVSGVDLADLCGTDGGVTDHTLTYRPAYNYLDPTPTFGYDNSVTYRQYNGDYVVDSGQALVRGDTVTVRPLTTPLSLSESGTGTIDIESFPRNTTQVSGPLTVTITTRLPPTEWERLLSGESRVESLSVTEPKTGPDDTATIDISLADGTYTVGCQAFGLDSTPDATAAEPEVPGEGGEGEDTINPAAPGDIELVNVSSKQNTVTLKFENKGSVDRTITHARIAFYDVGQDKKAPEYADLEINSSDRLVIGEELERTDAILLPAGETTEVTLDFYEKSGNSANSIGGNFFIFVAEYSGTDVKATYFISIPGNGGGNNN